MYRNTIIFLLAFLFGADCLSQQYPFINYTPKDGLVNNRARFMFQDKKGLLYICTFGGLSVYDGSRFTNYSTDDGLASNIINDIVEMGVDSLWIITNASRINCLVNGRIKDLVTSDGFYPVINKMLKCTDGFYYAMADEGLFRLEKNHFSKIKLTDSSGRDIGGHFIYGAEIKNKLFMITESGIQALAGPSRLIEYDLKNNTTAIAKTPAFFSILPSSRGDILVSTSNGIKKLDETALGQNKIRLVSPPPVYRLAEKLPASYMYFDRQQNLWLCTKEGVARIDSSGQLKLFSGSNGLPVKYYTSVFQDKENSIWFANDQTGISKLTDPNLSFYPQIKPGFVVTDVFTNGSTDSVWFLDGRDNKLLLQYGKLSKEFQLGRDLSAPSFRLFAASGNRNYLVDLFNIYQCRFSDAKKLAATVLYADTTRNGNIAFSCIAPDGHGNLIVLSENVIILRPGKKIISYPLGYFADGFVITRDNYLWTITRANKLFAFRIHPEDPDHYLQLLRVYDRELPVMNPRSITADENGNVWIGTRDKGLFCLFFDGLSLRSWKEVGANDGLSDNFISYLHADADNNVWACSPAGLDKIRQKNGRIFIKNITLASNIYQHIFKIQTSRQGIQYVTTQSGLIRINPSKTIPTSFQPKIIFRQISEGRRRIDEIIGPASLSYKENNISFLLAVPSFIEEKQARFSYLLEGSGNTGWSDPSAEAFINFVNLAPGKYTLKARALFINRRYPDSEILYSFTIHPPWWQTWWARLGLASFIAIMLVLVIRNYYQRKFQRQKVILEKQEAVEKERARIAIDMHDDLGAGLSTIRFLSEKVKRNTFSQVTREDIERMQTASNELIDKMNEIIWSMNEKNDSLEDLIFYTRSYAMEYCEENNLACRIQVPESIPGFFVSGATRRNVFLTVKESLHNIVKHAGAKNVDIIIEASEKLSISIKDNGSGLIENHKTPGGNGLRNMRKRIESIGGNMDIRNENGVTVTLNVPMA